MNAIHPETREGPLYEAGTQKDADASSKKRRRSGGGRGGALMDGAVCAADGTPAFLCRGEETTCPLCLRNWAVEQKENLSVGHGWNGGNSPCLLDGVGCPRRNILSGVRDRGWLLAAPFWYVSMCDSGEFSFVGFFLYQRRPRWEIELQFLSKVFDAARRTKGPWWNSCFFGVGAEAVWPRRHQTFTMSAPGMSFAGTIVATNADGKKCGRLENFLGAKTGR